MTQYLLFLFVVGVPVKVEQIINPQTMCTSHKTVHFYMRLQRAASAQAQDIQWKKLWFNSACLKIYIHQCVQLIHYDIYIIRSYPGRYNGYPFRADIPGVRNELTMLPLHFYAVK